MLLIFAHCRCAFGNSRNSRYNPKVKEVNYREEEKKILDSVLGPLVYDKRIRPSGINSTGKHIITLTLHRRMKHKNKYDFFS